ncbi:MAG: DUF2164 domain-containing protein [Candidatus Moranbacteria bacterium]|nr:DUF2164 domain-containing protein [Candidatus Moranbacteria bacterium]
MKKKWDLLSKEKREGAIKRIIAYFKNQKDQEIGILAAEELLDFFLEELVEDIYNKAVDDSKKAIKQNFDNLEIDLDLLMNK